MNRIFKIFPIFILHLFLLSSNASAGEEKLGQPQFKIVVGEDRSVKVYDMLGNLIADKPGTDQQSINELTRGLEGELLFTGYSKNEKSSELETAYENINKKLSLEKFDKISEKTEKNKIAVPDEKQNSDSVINSQQVQGPGESAKSLQFKDNPYELPEIESQDSYNSTKTDGVNLFLSTGKAEESIIQQQQSREESGPPSPEIDTIRNDRTLKLQKEGAVLPDRIKDTSASPNLMNYTGGGSDNNTTYNSTTHEITYNASVGNNGDANAGPFRIGLYISTNTIISTSDRLLMYANASSGLQFGYFLQVNGTIDLDEVGSLSAGTYYPGLYIDDQFDVSESNENDNTAYWNIPITWPPSSPNLTLNTSGTNNYNFDTSTHELSVTYTVQNDGSVAAGAFRVGLYLSTNTSITTTDNFLGYQSRSSLAAGSEYTSTGNIDLDNYNCSQIPTGTYYVGLIIDYEDVVSESDESDNAWYFTPTISHTCSGQPNLTRFTGTGAVRNYSYNSSTHIISLNYSVENIGDGAAGAFRVGWYLSDNTSISTSDPFLAYYDISGLAVGAWINTSNTKNVNDLCPLAAGDYYVGVIIDYQDTVVESDESDNNWYFTTPMTWDGCDTAKPNLTDYTGTGANNNMTYNTVQHTLTLSFSVQNDGDAAAGPFRVGWYLSENTSISTSDYFVEHDAKNSLAVGSYVIATASKDLDGFCNTPDEIPAGDYYVGVIIDDHFDIDEKDENDNIFYFASTINYAGCGTTSDYKISGTMNYYMGSAGVINDVKTDLAGDATQTTNTNSSGYYEFTSLAGGNYSVSASKARNSSTEAAISAFDASYILRYYVGDPALTLSEAQKIAADASGNGTISPFDASIVLRYYVGQDLSTYDIGNWQFVVPPVTDWTSPVSKRSYTPLSSDMPNQNFDGILIGDVTGNFTASVLAKAGEGAVVPGEMKSITENMLEMPVCIEGVSAYNAVSFELQIDKEQLKVENVTLEKENENLLMAFHEVKGNLRVAVASANSIKGSDLLRITFSKTSKANLNDVKIRLMGYEIDGKRVDSPQQWMVSVEKLPEQFELKQNYPNPFNPSTTIVYSVPQRSAVKIVIYNTIGQKLRELVNTTQDAGNYEYPWDGHDEHGLEAPSGIYIVRFQANDFSKTIKIVKTK